MPEYLVFTLSAALGAMGDLAGHERRGSFVWPGRSAVTGLIGAAMGLRREDDFTSLDELGMAVAIFDGGRAMRDYHTVETVPSAAAKTPNSRPEALRSAAGRTNTTITLRDYQVGPLFGVAIWNGPLAAIKSALDRPVFTLYLGRKSCPLSSQLAPAVVRSETPEAALRQLRLPPWRSGARATRLVTDAGDGDAHVETRHDRVIDRRKWHFAPRRVSIRSVDIAPAGGKT